MVLVFALLVLVTRDWREPLVLDPPGVLLLPGG